VQGGGEVPWKLRNGSGLGGGFAQNPKVVNIDFMRVAVLYFQFLKRMVRTEN
jgi:hypothetical protein